MSDLIMRWLKLSLVALVGCGFLGMVVYALWMRDEIRQAQVEPELISPPDTPVKRRPDEPGGMIIPNRDKLVFDLLDEASTGVSAPAPAPVAGQVAELPLAGAATPTVVVSPVQPSLTVVTAPPAPMAKVAARTATPQPKPVAQAAAAAPKPESKPASQPEVKSITASAHAGSWGVQVAAVGSNADAQKMAASLQTKFSALKGLTIATPAAPGGKWRVQFTGLASRDAAAKVCGALGGQPCFPITAK
jgi:cell division septation protein DedD